MIFALVWIMQLWLSGVDHVGSPRAVTLAKDTVNLFTEPDRTVVIVLYNNNSCIDCFDRLVDGLRKIDSEANTPIRFLLRVGSASSARRAQELALARRYGNVQVLFDLQAGAESDTTWYNDVGLFSQYGVHKTPAILVKHGPVAPKYFSYAQLFDATGELNLESLKIAHHTP